MSKKFLALFLIVLFPACASAPVAQQGPFKPKPFVTPYEYYRKTRPAIYTDQDKAQIQKASTSQPIGDDTHEDHHQAIIVGTLVGVAVIGGTVAGILLTR
jgi:hypothetical protein